MFSLFAKKSQLPAIKQLQVHEYLDLLREGTDKTEITGEPLTSSQTVARSLWPELGVGAWPQRGPQAPFSVRSRSSGKLLVHVPAGPPDSFLILVLSSQGLNPSEYILFDIGAQYMQPTFSCPAFGAEGKAEEATIRQCIPQLVGHRDPFAVLELREGTYMQVYADGDRFELEHQLVSTTSHYRTTAPVSAEEATTAFLSYAFGNNEWAHQHRWERINL
jgi:hypothetical protein